MKKSMQAGIVIVAMLAAATSAGAETQVSLGLKLWSSGWKETVKRGTGGSLDFDNGTALLVGPAVSARFAKNWFVDFTYLTALDDYESPDWFTPGDSMKFKERTDVDLVAGYLVHDPYNTDFDLGFFAAYKTIDSPASYSNPAAGISGNDIGTWKVSGPGLGMLAEKHFDTETRLYGRLSYFFLEQEFAFSGGSVSRFDTGGWVLEAAVERVFAARLAATLGVKFQRFKGEMQNGDDVTDYFSGLTAGIAYQF